METITLDTSVRQRLYVFCAPVKVEKTEEEEAFILGDDREMTAEEASSRNAQLAFHGELGRWVPYSDQEEQEAA